MTERRSSRFLLAEMLLPFSSSTAGCVSTLDRLSQADLVILGEQWVLPNVSKVEPDEIFLVPLNSFLGHGVPFPGFAWSARGLGIATQHPTPP